MDAVADWIYFAVVWLLGVVVVATLLHALGLAPRDGSIAATAGLLVLGGVVLAVVLSFRGYFREGGGRLF